MTKTALITGITGQDGSYLAEFLLRKGYEVCGIVFPGSARDNIANLKKNLQLSEGDVTDKKFIRDTIAELQPNELYNLASVSAVAHRWENPERILQSTGLAPFYILETIRMTSPRTRLFQASSAEMYGDVTESPQTEQTPFRPRNLYGVGKLMAHNLVEAYRRDQEVYSVSGILFNHESPRRRGEFVTRKITSTLARIASGSDEMLTLGNLEAKRDWSYAGDVVEAMWMALQADKPDTYAIASGEVHTVREFVEEVARIVGVELVWEGKREQEVGKDKKNGKVIVSISPEFYRPTEAHVRQGDITKISKELGWKPRTSFKKLVSLMLGTEEVMQLK
jgi:GDPmannose 4,6-dehydratase